MKQHLVILITEVYFIIFILFPPPKPQKDFSRNVVL